MNRTMNMVSMLAFAGVVALTPAANAVTILDTFNVAQSLGIPNSPAGPQTTSSTVMGTSADFLGGSRTLTIGRVNGPFTIAGDIVAGTANLSSGTGTDGFLKLDYSTPAFDITPSATGLSGQLAGDLGNVGSQLVLTITSASGSSSATVPVIPSGSSTTFNPFNIPFGTLMVTSGTGATLTAVTGVTLRLDGQNSFDGALRLLQFDIPRQSVPEPGSVALAFGMLGGAAFTLRRRARK